jgi:hypothetical protein
MPRGLIDVILEDPDEKRLIGISLDLLQQFPHYGLILYKNK